ncbi:hypothetical protein DMJ13_19080 [halophilic archaeon]|nr:hypothetical protein DMJ13_19080 [halophilic archaeon]
MTHGTPRSPITGYLHEDDVTQDFLDFSFETSPDQYAAVRDGVVLVGDEATVDAYREHITDEYEATADDRQREREEFIDRLASGDV